MPPSPWPTQVEYQDALLFPALCFADRELRAAAPADWTPFGLPRPVTGQFASVYRLTGADGAAWAVRLFLGPSARRTARWEALAAHLAALPHALPFLVPFDYQAEGVRVGGAWHPLVKMPFVTGADLYGWVEKRLYEGAALADAAERFRAVVGAMDAARFAHGDLQHGNILVEPDGTLRLVDYDGVFVPALAGQPSPETGHPSYQHPARTDADAGPHLDRFAALVIYTALRALAVAPELWYRLDNGDNLLFRREDFARPAASRAFAALEDALRARPEERRLLRALRAACDGPPQTVPALADAVR